MIRNLQRTTLRDQCLNALRSAITSGQLPTGHHLVETELAEAFGVSRGTLREAMRRLEQEGLLVAGSRGQLSVRHIEESEIHDIYRVRAALEALAARTLCEQPDRDERIATLASHVRRMHEVQEDLIEQIETDLNFHRALCELSGNQALLTTWLTLEGPIRISIMHAGLEHALHNMAADRHDLIVNTLAQGDATRIEQVLMEHMEEAARRLMTALEQRAEG
ncbi:DNA-binding GntR family transcriptional regulator [Kushneria sinocarnis]|uniref:DNA-binding GntR family transcriptional regulator n=1 Tax=Kushneria sinocarnis TaxID=595502 RepID=A0A420WVV9_9GAMM|nr:GntR family transcriptional regulator [Kushneria sinocarnis]RKR03269.1 DNA-binding GntR family transcriptional regulator [Kushneria sinocarnis]